MEQGLQIFNHPDFGGIRGAEIDGDSWLVGKDVCEMLGDTNYRRTLHNLEEDERVCHKIKTPGGEQEMTLVNEAGFYSLLFKMQPKKAKGVISNDALIEERVEKIRKFKRWITHEVLPTIRKTGGYVNNEDLFLNTYLPYADESTKKLFSATLSALRAANQKIEADKPKVLFADAVSVTKSEITIGELSKLLKQNGINVGRNRLFEILRASGFLIREKGKDRSLPTQRSMELGLFRVKESTIHANGEVILSRTPYVTGKGITYFMDKFLSGALRA